MRRHVTISVATALVPVVVMAALSVTPGSRAQAAADSAGACPRGSVRAVVAGKRVCLRPGQRCTARYESTYRRYGFSCRAGKLVRRKQPKPPLPPGASVAVTIDLGEKMNVVWLAASDSSVWVHGSSEVIRVDPSTNAIVARVATPPIGFGYLAAGDGAVWQTDFGENSLLRIDPSSNRVVATIPLGEDAAPEGVGVTPGAVWVALHHRGEVARIDPATNEVVARIRVGPSGNRGPLKLAAGPAGVWVDVPNTSSVVNIDPQTNAVVGKVDFSGIPVIDGTDVWIVALNRAARIDPATHRVLASASLQGLAADGAAGLGSVWVTTSTGLVRIDQASSKVVGRLVIGKGDVAVSAGSVWVAQYGSGRLLRLAPR